MSATKTINAQHALNHMNPASKRVNLGDVLSDLIIDANYDMVIPAALALNTSGNITAVTGAASLANVGGTLVQIASATTMSALAGVLPTAKTGLWVFYTDSAGTISTSPLVYGATAAAALALIPVTPSGKTVIGFILVANATGSNFTGATTALNAGSVTTTYYSITGNINTLVTLQNRTTAQV